METPEKNFNYKEYRKDLAKDLKNIRNDGDMEGANRVLGTVSKQEEYEIAKEAKDLEVTFIKTLKEMGYGEYGYFPRFDGLGNVSIDNFTCNIEDGLEIAKNKLLLQKRFSELGYNAYVDIRKDGQVYTRYFNSEDINSAIETLEQKHRYEEEISKEISSSLDREYGVFKNIYNYSPRYGSGSNSSSYGYKIKDGRYLSFYYSSNPNRSRYGFNVEDRGPSIEEIKEEIDKNNEEREKLLKQRNLSEFDERMLSYRCYHSFEEEDINRFKHYLKELSPNQLKSLARELGLDL